jgi:polysaccharide export outer membrane protein
MLPYCCGGRKEGRRLLSNFDFPGGLVMVATARYAGVVVAVLALMLWPGRVLAAPPIPTNGYTIGPEDLLDVTVWNNAGISRTVPVRPDGKISLPLLDDVQAAGLTPKQLKDDLARRLAKYISSPEVSVIVREIHSLRVAVLGEVNRPGRYDLRSRASVLDALALAGGFSPYAARSKMVILRVEGSTVKRIPCNFNKVVAAEIDPGSFFLQAGDTLVVP